MDPNAIDDQTRSLMSPDELAAITEEPDPAEIEALKGIAAEAGDDDADEGGADDDAPTDGADHPPVESAATAPAQAAEAPAAGDAGQTAGAATDDHAPAEEAPQPTAAPAPYSFELPEDYQARVEANRKAQADLYQQYKDGDLSVEELQAKQSALNDERDELLTLRMRADVAADMQRQSLVRQRDAAINALFDTAAKAPQGAIDYRKDDAARQDLDRAVKLLAAEPANEDKPLAWFLDQGHRMVRAMRGLANAAAPAPTPGGKVDPKAAVAAAAAARRVDASAAPRTLAQVPGGDGPGDVGGEFQDVMELDGEEFEQALEHMARTNPQRYARFQASQH